MLIRNLLDLSCRTGEVSIIKFLAKNSMIQMNYNNDEPLRSAVLFNQIDVVKYLLTSKDIKCHININADNDSAILQSCGSGFLEIVKYLLTLNDTDKKVNIHAINDYAFKYAFRNKHIDIVEYLVFDYKIPLTDEIKMFFIEEPSVKDIFDKRELIDKLKKMNTKKEEKINKL